MAGPAQVPLVAWPTYDAFIARINFTPGQYRDLSKPLVPQRKLNRVLMTFLVGFFAVNVMLLLGWLAITLANG